MNLNAVLLASLQAPGLNEDLQRKIDEYEAPPPVPVIPLAKIPTPRPGKNYALGAPFWAVQVVGVDARWVRIRHEQGEDVPTRIRRRHWAGKDPVELTPELVQEILSMARAEREAAEKGITLSPVEMGSALGSRGRAILMAIAGLG